MPVFSLFKDVFCTFNFKVRKTVKETLKKFKFKIQTYNIRRQLMLISKPMKSTNKIRH